MSFKSGRIARPIHACQCGCQSTARLNGLAVPAYASFQHVRDTQRITMYPICLPRYCMTLVRLITLRSAILASLVKTSSWTPSAKNACSLSSLRFSNGSTAMPVVTGCSNSSVFKTIQPAVATNATNDAAKRARWISPDPLPPFVMTPACRARIVSVQPMFQVFSQRDSGRITALRIFLETLEADRGEIAIYFWNSTSAVVAAQYPAIA